MPAVSDIVSDDEKEAAMAATKKSGGRKPRQDSSPKKATEEPKKNDFYFFLEKGQETPEGCVVKTLPDKRRVAIKSSALYETRSKKEMTVEVRKELFGPSPDRGRCVRLYEDDKVVIIARRYPWKKSASSTKTTKKLPRRPVKNPCGFNGCKAPRRLCEGLKRHHWASIPPPISGKEETMIIPAATPPSGPNLDPATWFRAYEVDSTTQIKIEEIKSGVAMHSTEATVKRAEIDAGVIKHKTDAEVQMNDRKFAHLDHKVTVQDHADARQHDYRAAADRRSTMGLLAGILLVVLAIPFIMWAADRYGGDDNTPTPIVCERFTCGSTPPSCGGGCDGGGDITINIDIDDVVGTTVPCDCTTTTVPATSTTTLPPATTSTTSTTIPPTTTTTTTVPPTTTTTTTVPPTTTTTTVPDVPVCGTDNPCPDPPDVPVCGTDDPCPED